MHSNALNVMAALETRKGGYVLAIITALLLPVLRVALDTLVFMVRTILEPVVQIIPLGLRLSSIYSSSCSSLESCSGIDMHLRNRSLVDGVDANNS